MDNITDQIGWVEYLPPKPKNMFIKKGKLCDISKFAKNWLL